MRRWYLGELRCWIERRRWRGPAAGALVASFALGAAAAWAGAAAAFPARDGGGTVALGDVPSLGAFGAALRRGPVLLLGDSMMKVGVGPALRQALIEGRKTAVELTAKSSSGLARPDFFDWPKAAAAASQAKPYRAVVVLLGTNDCQGMTEAGHTLRFGTLAWVAEYQRRVREMLAILCDDGGAAAGSGGVVTGEAGAPEGGRHVVWLGLPAMRERGFDRRIVALEAAVEAEVGRAPCARYLPTRRALGNAKGGYVGAKSMKRAGDRPGSPQVRRWTKLRDDDGIHLTAQGGAVVSELLLTTLGE